MLLRVVCVLLLLCVCPQEGTAAALRICTQNLQRLGQPDDRADHAARLAERIHTAGCAVVGVQEIFGENKSEAKRSANRLRRALETATATPWQMYIADTRDKNIRNGFLVRVSAGTVQSFSSLARENLPSVQAGGPLRYFSRGPARLVLSVPGLPEPLVLYSIHFKSKVDGWKDPTKRQFEALRVEMADAVRKHAERAQGIAIILGDRNSDHRSATADVLTGRYVLNDFRTARCRISRALRAVCPKSLARGERFVEMFERGHLRAIDRKEVGSYKYRGKWELIDEILVKTEGVAFVSGPAVAVGEPQDGASDHRLLYIDMFPR